MIVITGASGNTGSIVAEMLLAKGEKVRVIGRDAKKLERFLQKGAEAVVTSLENAAALERAFAGATAVYTLVPPNVSAPDMRAYQELISDAVAAAVERARVPYVVNLSSVGGDKAEKVGPVVGLHRMEEKLNRIAGANVLHLRPAYFMENHLALIGLIQKMGMFAGTLRGDKPIPMIATRDVGAAAAEAILALKLSGKQTQELLGPRDYSMDEAASIIGKAIGKPGLSYTGVPRMLAKPALMQMGLSESTVDALFEMNEALNSGFMAPLELRSPQNTTPTTLEQFAAEEFAPRFQGKAAGA